MCGGGSKTQKTNSTSTYTPNATAMDAYGNALAQGQQLADTPFNYDTTKNVAGFNPQQTQSFNQIGQMQGMFAPYIDAAGGYTAAGAAPITGAQLQNYQNPYQQQVIDAAMANINHQNNVQQRDLLGNVAGAQGLGNNRAGIMQAELARGQGANTAQTIANLLSGGFNTALGAAQQDSNRQLTAGNQFANYGNLAQSLSLQGSQALNAAGTQQQQQLQAMYDAASGNQQSATMWPYQNAMFQEQMAQGLGPLMGGTTTGTSTTKQTANPGMAGYVGGGLSLLGALANGGRVGYADGGGIDMSGFSFPNMSIRAAQPIIPQLPGAPNMGGNDQSAAFDPKKSFDLGKNARRGVDDIIRGLDPAKGWSASIEDVGSAGGGGFLSGLGGLLGFADGGTLPAAPHLTGSAYIPAAGSVPGAAPDSYYAPGLAALTKSRGPQQASAPSPISPPIADVPTTGNGKGLGGLGDMFSHLFAGNQGGDGISDWIARLQQHHARGGAVRHYDDGGMVDSDPFASFGYDPRLKDADFQAPANPWYNRSLVDLATGNSKPHNTNLDDFLKQRNAPAPTSPDFDPKRLVPTQSMAEMAAPLAQNVGEIGDVPAGLAALGAPAKAQGDLDPLDLIKREEGYAPTAKWDVRQYSGGYGSKAERGETFTQEKADAYLKRDAAAPLAWVVQNVPDATPQQKAALASFGYNEGVGALDNLKPDIAAGDWSKVGAHMQLYNKSRDDSGNLIFNPGLDARRKRETALLSGGDLGSLAQPSYPSPSGGDAPPAAKGLVAKGLDPEQPQASKSYANAADKHAGGLLKKLFGIDFNPLNLDRDERMALITAGLGMMSTGNIGSGGLMGMESLQNSMKMRQDANLAAQKLAIEMEKERAPKLMKGGTDAAGNDIMVWADPYHRTATPVDIAGSSNATSGALNEAMQNGVTGQAFLDILQKESPEAANMVKKMGNFEIPIPSTRNAKTSRLISLTEQAFPGWNAQDYTVQRNLKNSFGSGSDSKEVTSYNTVMDHLDKSYNSIDKLGNTRSSLLNAPVNAVKGQISPDFQRSRSDMITYFDRAIAEVNKATSGNPITVSEQKYWHDRIGQNAAPEDLKETVRAFSELINGRMKGLANKWNTGLKLTEDDPRYKTADSFFKKDAAQKYSRIVGGQPTSSARDGTRTQSTSGPAIQVSSPQEAMTLIKTGKLKSGDHFVDENGVDRTVH